MIVFEPALAQDLPALVTIAVSALCYAAATLCARSLRSVHPFVMQGWMAATAILPMALLSALAVSLVAHVGMCSLYRHDPVAHVIPDYVLMPVFGIAFSQVLFAEVPSGRTLLGGAIVITGAWVANRSTAPRPLRQRDTVAAGMPAPDPEGSRDGDGPSDRRGRPVTSPAESRNGGVTRGVAGRRMLQSSAHLPAGSRDERR